MANELLIKKVGTVLPSSYDKETRYDSDSFEYDSNGCLVRMVSANGGRTPYVRNYRCFKTSTGIRRALLNNPGSYDEFDSAGRIVFRVDSNTPVLTSGGEVREILSKSKIVYEEESGFLSPKKFNLDGGNEELSSIDYVVVDPTQPYFRFVIYQAMAYNGWRRYQYLKLDEHNDWISRETFKLKKPPNSSRDSSNEISEGIETRSIEYWQ